MEERSYFDGGLLQLIGWRILGALVTAITFGICFPWSFCMIYRWETKHTVIDGRRLVFDGTSLQLFGNWVKWTLLTIITFGIYSFWLPIKFTKWKTRHTHFMDGGMNFNQINVNVQPGNGNPPNVQVMSNNPTNFQPTPSTQYTPSELYTPSNKSNNVQNGVEVFDDKEIDASIQKAKEKANKHSHNSKSTKVDEHSQFRSAADEYDLGK